MASSTAKSFLSFFAKKTRNIVKNVPILGQIAETFQEVYDIYDSHIIPIAIASPCNK